MNIAEKTSVIIKEVKGQVCKMIDENSKQIVKDAEKFSSDNQAFAVSWNHNVSATC